MKPFTSISRISCLYRPVDNRLTIEVGTLWNQSYKGHTIFIDPVVSELDNVDFIAEVNHEADDN